MMIYELVLAVSLVYVVCCYVTVAKIYYEAPPGLLVSVGDHVKAAVVMLLAPITVPLGYIVARSKGYR